MNKRTKSYLKRLNKVYDASKRYMALLDNDDWSRNEFIAEDIFDYTTYNGGISDTIANNMLEVIDVISKNQSVYFVKRSSEHELRFIMLVNNKVLYPMLDWGTSIRGAVFNTKAHTITVENRNKIKIQKGELMFFMEALLAFAKDK